MNGGSRNSCLVSVVVEYYSVTPYEDNCVELYFIRRTVEYICTDKLS